jgi:hypothetical protein
MMLVFLQYNMNFYLPTHPNITFERNSMRKNHTKDGSVVTPLLECLGGDNFLEGFVLPTNPPLINPFSPLL